MIKNKNYKNEIGHSAYLDSWSCELVVG